MRPFLPLLDRNREGLPGTEPMEVYPEVHVTDSRGNFHSVPSEEPVTIWVQVSEDKSQDAELAGQIQVQTYKVTSRSREASQVASYSQVFWRDRWWDVVGDTFFQRGVSDLTSNYHFMIRSRPVPGGPVGGVAGG